MSSLIKSLQKLQLQISVYDELFPLYMEIDLLIRELNNAMIRQDLIEKAYWLIDLGEKFLLYFSEQDI